MGGDHLLIIETHHGYIIRNGKIKFAQRIIGTHGHAVIETKQGGRRVGHTHECLRTAVTAIGVRTHR